MDKILKLQSEIGVLSKTEVNPFYKSKFFNINGLLAELQPLLEKHGLVVCQPLGVHDSKNTLETIVVDAETGKELAHSIVYLPNFEDPQKMGSAITYYRRYALQSLFLLQAEDDDANLGSGKKAPQTASQPQSEHTEDVPPEVFNRFNRG